MDSMGLFLKEIQPYALAGIFIIIYIVEQIIPQRKELIDYKHDGWNVLVGVGNLVVIGLGGYYFQLILTICEQHQFGALYYLPIWVRLPLGFLLADFFMYWWHRLNHILPFLWYFHRFHHQDRKLNTTSSVRFHTGELILSYILKVPFFLLIGISVNTLLLYGLVFAIVVTLHHSNIRIGDKLDRILRKFIVSPKMHRIHHSVIRSETDSNYSSVLPYWDLLFGSYIWQVKEPIEFGINRKV